MSHGVASGNVVEQGRSPGESEAFFVEVVDEESVDHVLLETTVHEVEVYVLVAW